MMKGRHLRVGLLCMSILVERIQLIEIHAGQCGHEGHGHSLWSRTIFSYQADSFLVERI